MQHIFLPQCESTQSSFKQYWAQREDNEKHLLISSAKQTAGVGRRASQWMTGEQALAMSCSIPAQPIITHTPLELGLKVVQFFKSKNIKLFLKWPNDLLNENGEKVGGLLCQSLDQNLVLAGIGINLYLTQKELQLLKDVPYPVGHLHYHVEDRKDLAQALYQFVLRSEKFNRDSWNKYCWHLNKQVEIRDADQVCSGEFIGIDHDGAALIQNKDRQQRILTGSLRVTTHL